MKRESEDYSFAAAAAVANGHKAGASDRMVITNDPLINDKFGLM